MLSFPLPVTEFSILLSLCQDSLSVRYRFASCTTKKRIERNLEAGISTFLLKMLGVSYFTSSISIHILPFPVIPCSLHSVQKLTLANRPECPKDLDDDTRISENHLSLKTEEVFTTPFQAMPAFVKCLWWAAHSNNSGKHKR